MPKKKPTEEVPQAIAEGSEETAVQFMDSPGADTEVSAVGENVVGLLEEGGSFLGSEKENELDVSQGDPLAVSSVEETEEIVTNYEADEPAPEMHDAFSTSEAPDTSSNGQKSEEGPAEPLRSSDATAKHVEEPAATEEATRDKEERTPEDERRAFYDLDFNDLDRNLTPEQQQEWNSIYASYRGHNAMSGTIIGVDRHRLRVRDRKTGEMTSQHLYCAIVIPFRVRILIPETELWMSGEERPGYVIRNLAGARIDFVIIHVDREAGFAVGSRRQALPSRRYYFATRPELNAPNSRTDCEVLVVGPRRCLVSCHGYDIDLTQRDMSYTAVPDLREVYHSGQTLGCIVKSFDRRANHLSISVKETAPNPYDGAEFRHPVQSHRQGVIAGKYGGGVFCNLPDGVTVMCNYSFHYDDASFRSGDRVMLIIQRYDDQKKQVYGKIVAKC